MKRQLVKFLVVSTLAGFAPSVSFEIAQAAPPNSELPVISKADVDDLPTEGWRVKKYLNGDPDSSDPFDWPTRFLFVAEGWAVEVECKQNLVPIPGIGTVCSRSGTKFWCNSGEGQQKEFELIEIIEEPPPPPVLASFTVESFCPSPGKHSDDLIIRVTALDNKGNPFAGAQVHYAVEGGPQNGGVTEGDGVFSDTLVGARDFVGRTVTVKLGNLEPKTFTITEELLEPCTGRCDTLAGSYDPSTDSVTLTVNGAQPGWNAVIRNITLGGNSQVCSGVLNQAGELTCVYKLKQEEWGKLIFDAQVGGLTGPTCTTQVETPFPANFVVHGDCPTHGRDSDDLIYWGEMLDREGKPFTKPISATITLPTGESKAVELVNGKLETQTFAGGKAYVGQDIKISWAQGGESTLKITAEMFAPCRTPTPTPTPTKTPPPGAGWDPFARPVAGTPVPAIQSLEVASHSSRGFPWTWLLLTAAIYYGGLYLLRRSR